VSGAVYEYRRYDIVPGRIGAIQTRFADHTVGFWKKHGIRCVGFWEAVVGETNQLHYILEWESMAERERLWDAYQGDPAWQAARADSEKNGPLVQRVHNEFWRLTRFSPRPAAT
jgi:hypothetical protein